MIKISRGYFEPKFLLGWHQGAYIIASQFIVLNCCDPTFGPAPFFLLCWQKGVFLPIPPDRGDFVPSHFDITL